MPLSKVYSAAVVGLEVYPIEVEVDISNGLPAFTIVGLPDKSVEEAKDRVRSAIRNSGADFPAKRITVNLAPADLKKAGPIYDLPIALGVLAADNQIPAIEATTILVGELALDGKLRYTNGILPIVSSLGKDFSRIILPKVNAPEASLVRSLEILPAETLKDLVFYFKKEKVLPFYTEKYKFAEQTEFENDFTFIKGQEQAKRALEIAAAGGHNVIFSGSPGSGKTMLARSFPSILPILTEEEILEVTKIYSVAGLLKNSEPVVNTRPFRSPHHTTSSIALVGGGAFPRPGEITLAHRGVLFMDEFAEFPRTVLEALRQPLEDGVITVSRAQGSITFPAQFILVAAQNPCPCGYLGDSKKNCICAPSQILRYQKRVSGPLLDRIDIHLEIPRLTYEKLSSEKVAESSADIRCRVNSARAIQLKRFGKTNAEMSAKDIKTFCGLNEQGKNLLRQAINQLGLSARQFTRVLKIARTIADLEGLEHIGTPNLAEALQYRPKEKQTY